MDHSINDSTTKIYDLRQAYLNLPINAEPDGDKIWVKKLQNVLATDIHSKPLGCKVEDTHVRIGEVHIDTFFEAQILFSHNYWVSRFAGWLTERILDKANKANKSRIVLIGYETYVEPMLYRIERNIEEKREGKNVKYLIYEEKKYIQTNKTTNESRIRYADEYEDIENKEETVNESLFVFICGISSTLKTFDRMTEKFFKEVLNIQDDKDSIYYSIIQVLPNNYDEGNGERIFDIDDGNRIKWSRKNDVNTIERSFDKRTIFYKRTISAVFLADVYCKWYPASKCKWCYPEVPLEERPIIETSETSVIPMQLIQENRNEQVGNDSDKSKKGQASIYKKNLNFFEKSENRDYKYKKYLYYDHIDRDGHHYQYYFRTGHLFRKIFSDDIDKFEKDCMQIRSTIGEEDIENSVNVIVSPRHFSDGMFPQAINDYVFGKFAHIISLDIKKEYRSNFSTKYSNYAYFLEQTQDIEFLEQVRGTEKKLNFYFVDDQIISGATFYRAKSLITSLMGEHVNDGRLNIFAGIFVLVNRMSQNTKRDYIPDVNRFFSFIDIFIPSIRSYGDSCPICKLNKDAKECQQKSALSCSAYYWSHKQKHHCIKTLDEVKEERKKPDFNLSERHFNRLLVENTLWGGFQEKGNIVKGISAYQSKDDILKFFSKAVNDNKYYKSVELTISFVKAISRAFIYYRENAKKATLKILISFMQYLTEDGNVTIDGAHFEDIEIKSNYERYSLLVILINALASVDSTYLLNADRILSIYNCVLDWQEGAKIVLRRGQEETPSDLCRFIDNEKDVLVWYVKEGAQMKEYQIESFYSVVLNAYKRIICGISGGQKLNKFNQTLKDYVSVLYRDEKNHIIVCTNKKEASKLKKCELYKLTLLRAMMLESVDATKSLEDENIVDKVDKVDKVEKYEKYAKSLAKKIDTDKNTLELTFYYYDTSFGNCFIEMKSDARKMKLAKIFDSGQEKDDLTIKNSLLSNGFYHVSDMWMVDLRHFVSDADAESSSYYFEKYMCLLFKFNSKSEDEAKKAFAQIEAIRNILKYRHWLTVEIAKDIRAGSIKSSIQAKKAKSLLNTDKIVTHNGHADLLQILHTTYGEIEACISNKKYDFVRICDMANSMMNMLISYANIHIVNKDYFSMGEEYRDGDSPFLREVQCSSDVNDTKQKQQRGLLEAYFNEIFSDQSKYLEHVVDKSDRNGVKKIKVIFDQAAQDTDETKSVKEIINEITMFPLMLKKSERDESCVFFIAIIDLFLRNAAKHGKLDGDTIKVNINISKLGDNSEYVSGYSLSLTNKKNSGNRNGGNGITWKVLEFFNGLEILDNVLYGFTIEKTSPVQSDKFTAKLSCFCKKDDSPLSKLLNKN